MILLKMPLAQFSTNDPVIVNRDQISHWRIDTTGKGTLVWMANGETLHVYVSPEAIARAIVDCARYPNRTVIDVTQYETDHGETVE